MTIELRGRATPDDARTYRLLAVDVPENCTRLAVRYAFGEEIGTNTGSGIIDIGIFDPRGSEFLGAGFRGWSGSARREFFITTEEATPGYLSGPLYAGTWQICLGLYEIDPNGCEYVVTVDISEGENAPQGTFKALLTTGDRVGNIARRAADGWYKGELHCHTFHSDGDSHPLDIIAQAEKLGLDFLAITDHNVLSQHAITRTAETDLILIPGMEVTTYRGHWNVWGDGGWLDFRVTTEADMRRSMETAIERGYLVSCNHPRPHGPEWEYADLDTFHCVEVWNGPWPILNDISLTFWENHLTAGKRYTAVGGSDTHFLKQQHIAKLANPTTFIYCADEPTPANLLASLRAGRAFVTSAPDGAQIRITSGDVMMGGTVTPENGRIPLQVTVKHGNGTRLQVRTAAGTVRDCHVSTDDFSAFWWLDVADTPFVRAQVTQVIDGGMQVRALTNPIYISAEA